MERDINLIREILISLRKKKHSGPSQMLVKGYSKEVIYYHCQLLADAGYMKVAILSTGAVLPRALTESGYEFANALKYYMVWDQAVKKGLTGSLESIKEIIQQIEKDEAGDTQT